MKRSYFDHRLLTLTGSVFALLLCASAANADGMPMSSKESREAVAAAQKAGMQSEGAATEANEESANDEAQQGSTAYTGPKLDEFDLARYQYCGSDDDCIVSINGCCDCENGAEEVAINKERIGDFRSQFSCGEIACGDRLTSTRCGTGVVSCVDHRCKYFVEDEEI